MVNKTIKLSIMFIKPLSDVTGTENIEIEMESGTVYDLLIQLCKRYPLLRQDLLGEGEKIGEYINILIDDQPIPLSEEGAMMKLHNGAKVTILHPLSG